MTTSITYTVGDATLPPRDQPAIIAHVCNDSGGWGRGFVLALSKRWAQPEADYRAWAKAPDFGLGRTRLVQVEDDLWVANMVAQRGTRSKHGVPPIRYDASARRWLPSVSWPAPGERGSTCLASGVASLEAPGRRSAPSSRRPSAPEASLSRSTTSRGEATSIS